MNSSPDSKVSPPGDWAFLTQRYLPEARWTLGGGVRFRRSVRTMADFFQRLFPLRRIGRVGCVVPCAWSLDWFGANRPVPLEEWGELLEEYARIQTGVTLVFDNPLAPRESLEDPYALGLVRELDKRDRVRLNAVCVASDALAARLREEWPRLPIHCHVNRLVMENGRRTPALYEKLLAQYRRVCLHPADAVRPALYQSLSAPSRCDVVMNDACLRTCPVRREHVRVLAEKRLRPYDSTPDAQKEVLLARAGCRRPEEGKLVQKRTCNLTRAEACRLYEAGFRSFIIQSQQFRNELTFLWDILFCLLDRSPELSNKAAMIAAAAMAQLDLPTRQLPSGLHGFSFSNDA